METEERSVWEEIESLFALEEFAVAVGKCGGFLVVGLLDLNYCLYLDLFLCSRLEFEMDLEFADALAAEVEVDFSAVQNFAD